MLTDIVDKSVDSLHLRSRLWLLTVLNCLNQLVARSRSSILEHMCNPFRLWCAKLERFQFDAPTSFLHDSQDFVHTLKEPRQLILGRLVVLTANDEVID